MTRHALVVPFLGLAPVIDEWRERTCATKPSHGMPPHVTLLVPCPGDVATISEALAPFGGFDVTFAAVDRFPGTLWLAPEPAARFRWLTAALVAAFPGHPPYGGMFSEVVPHLTVAQAELDEAAADVVEWLPLHSRADAAVLFEQVQPDHWRERATFDLDAGEP